MPFQDRENSFCQLYQSFAMLYEVQTCTDPIKNSRPRSKEVQTYMSYLSRGPTGSTHRNINNFIRIKHRRKNNQSDIRKSVHPTLKKYVLPLSDTNGRISCISGTPEKQPCNRHFKRNTHHVFQDQESIGQNRASRMSSKPRQQIKLSLYEDMSQEKISTKNIVFRPIDKYDKTKSKDSTQGNVRLLRKISKDFNKTTSNFIKNVQAEPLVDLIGKFKFQNLKTAVTKSPRVGRFIQYQKNPERKSIEKITFFPAAGKETHTKTRNLKYGDRERKNKTVMGWKSKETQGSHAKNIVSLTPWQGETLEVIQVSQFF